MYRITIPVVALSILLGACAGAPELLPHSLYYRDGAEGDSQVWRMAADGTTKVQVTHEEGELSDFAVSPADGSLALVVNNKLYLVDGDGGSRRLIADDSHVDKNAEDYAFRGFIETPVFSPDGRTLAYAFNGLHLYDLDKGEDVHVLTNLGNLFGEPFVFAKENYFPASWSPDGGRLLIVMGYFEGSTLAVMDREAAQPFARLWSNGPVCCQFRWASDGRSVLVANPFYTGERPGLWRYDAETGEETVLMMGTEEGGSEHYVGWPHQLDSGALVYFYANLESFSPDEGIPLVMVRSNPDGSDRTQLRQDAFHVNQALWADDGSWAVVLNRGSGDGWQVVLARTDKSPLQVLTEGEHIMDLAWGP